MQITTPPPIMAEYIVVELRTEIDKTTKRQRLVSDSPRAVNTVEMGHQVHLDGLFIVAWREIHQEVYYDNLGAPRFRERYETKTHLENQVRVNLVGKAWADWSTRSEGNPLVPFEAPTLQSMERDLLALGWKFEYAPGVGPVYPIAWESQLNCLLERNDAVEAGLPAYSVPIDSLPTPEPIRPSVPQVNDNERLDTLELKMDKLMDLIGNFINVQGTQNENNNDPGSGE